MNEELRGEFRNLPQTWTVATFGEVGSYINGRAFRPSEWEETGRPIIRIQNLTGTGSTYNYCSKPVEDKYLVRDGDLLISWSATLGAFIYRGEEAVLNQHIFRVESYVNKKYLYFLTLAFLESLKRKVHGSGMQHITKGKFEESQIPIAPINEQRKIVEKLEEFFTQLDAGVAALKRAQTNLKRYKASVLKAACEGRLVPTEAELARAEGRDYEAASVLLERIRAGRRKKWEEEEWEKLVDKSKQKAVKARLKVAGRSLKRGEKLSHEEWQDIPQEAYTKYLSKDEMWKEKYKEPEGPGLEESWDLPQGWVWATLEELSWDSGYGTSQKCTYESNGPPVIRIPNIVRNSLNLEDLKFATCPSELSQGRVIAPGDLLIIRTNGSRNLIGRSALVRKDLIPEHYYASYLIRYRLLNDNDVDKWISAVWNSPIIRQQIVKFASTSAGQYNMNIGSLNRLCIPLPPIQEQKRVMSQIDLILSQIQELESVCITGYMRANSLRRAILQKAFCGGFSMQDPEDEPTSVLLDRIKTMRNKKY